MRELRPLVNEYEELERVAQRLRVGTTAESNESQPAANTTGRRRATRARSAGRGSISGQRGTARKPATARTASRAAGSSRAAQGQRRQQVLDLVKARPGITVRELGAELGVDPTSLYRVVHALEKDHVVTKQGRELTAT
jgi:hypothetical protein